MANEIMTTEEKYMQAKAYMMGINRIKDFPVEALAAMFDASNGEKIVILPLAVKLAWFRALYAAGHCTDEPFGVCDENIANVKVTVYATGDTSCELAHGYATRAFNPSIDVWMTNPAERRVKLYNQAVGMAKSKALTEAGIGMGYYTSKEEFDEISFETVNTVSSPVSEAAETVPETGKVEGFAFEAPQTKQSVQTEAEPEERTNNKKSAAAVAEEKLNAFKALATEISETWNGYTSCDEFSKTVLEKKLRSLMEKYQKALEDLEKRADKGVQNEGNGISRVLTHAIIAMEASKVPEALRIGGDPFEVTDTNAEEAPAPAELDFVEEAVPVNEAVNTEGFDIESEATAVPETEEEPVIQIAGFMPEQKEEVDADAEEVSAEVMSVEEDIEDASSYMVGFLGKTLAELNDKQVSWIALSNKKDITDKDRAMAKQYYKAIATAENYELFERKLAAQASA